MSMLDMPFREITRGLTDMAIGALELKVHAFKKSGCLCEECLIVFTRQVVVPVLDCLV